MAVVNSRSEKIYLKALIETGLDEMKRRVPWPNLKKERDIKPDKTRPETIRFQGIRVVYSCLDRDSTNNNIIMNRIVNLKEDAKKE